MKRALAPFALAAIGVALLLTPASAMAPDAHGWWWFAQPPGAPAGVVKPPFVPENGLYVASNPSGAEAVSALRFTLPEGTSAGMLTLRISGEVRGTPVLGLCLVTEPWEPVQGGALSDAPPYDCAAGAAAGTVAEDGTTVSFQAALLEKDGVLDVAVVPGQDETGGSPTFQVAFEPPDADTLAPGMGGDESDVSSDPLPPPVTSSGSGGSSGSSGSPSFAPVASPSSPVPQLPEPTPVVPGDISTPAPTVAPSAGSDTGSGVAAAPLGDGTPDDDGNRTRLLGFVVLAAAAFAYHRLSTTPERAPRALVRFGQLPEEAESAAAPTGALT